MKVVIILGIWIVSFLFYLSLFRVASRVASKEDKYCGVGSE